MSTLDSQDGHMLYKVYFTNDEPPELARNEIWVNNVLDIKNIIYCIGNNVKIIFDEYIETNYREIVRLVKSGNPLELSKDMQFNYRDPQEAVAILKKIHMLEWVKRKLAENPKPIDKKYVHKHHSKNVSISTPVQSGNLYYFQGFEETKEIQIDHQSDHLDGIKIFEISRQASIAAMILSGFPIDGVNILIKNSIEFNNFIEEKEQFYIQALPVVRPRGGTLYCAFAIIQNNNICSVGYFSGIGYKSKDAYMRLANR